MEVGLNAAPLCPTPGITPVMNEYGPVQLHLRRKPIITLLLEVDVVLLPEPGVGQVARVRLCLAGEECILGYVDGDVFGRRDDVRRPWETHREPLEGQFADTRKTRALIRGQFVTVAVKMTLYLLFYKSSSNSKQAERETVFKTWKT